MWRERTRCEVTTDFYETQGTRWCVMEGIGETRLKGKERELGKVGKKERKEGGRREEMEEEGQAQKMKGGSTGDVNDLKEHIEN